MSSFGKYFERDYITGEQFVELFGLDKPTVFQITGFGMRESFDSDTQKKMPKPVIFLAELPGKKPMFLNRTGHEALLDRFGEEYEDKPSTLNQLITIVGWETKDKQGRRLMAGGEILNTVHPDQHASIGPKVAEKWLARLKEFGGTPDKFLHWLQPQSHELHAMLRELDPPDYPRGALHRMGQYIEAALKTAPRDAVTGKVEPPKQPAPAVKPAAPVTPNPVPAKPPEKPVEIREDDIPF